MEIVRNIESSFYPELYSERLVVGDGLSLCLVRKQGLATYVLAVLDFDPEVDVDTQISEARRAVRRQTGALWFVKEVGAYIVFIADELPKIDSESLTVDSTGFHAVIVQGVHIVSTSGKHLFNHTKWLTRQFGGAASIAERIVASAI